MIRKRIILIFLSFFFTSLQYGDVIILKNNEKFEGEIIKEENDYVLIRMPIGSARIEKNDILKVNKTSNVDSTEVKLDKMLKTANNKKDYIEAADFAFENNMNEKGIIILQRAWTKNKNDTEIKERIDKEKIKELEKILNEAGFHFKEGNFRVSAEMLHKSYKKFITCESLQEEFWGLKRELYKILIDEKSTKEFLHNLIQIITNFTKKENKKINVKKNQETKDFNILDFYQQEKKLSFEYSSVISEIHHILQIRNHIEKNKYNEVALKSLNSKQTLDAARVDANKFNQLNKENNNIYQARIITKKYNQLIKQLNYNFNKINDKLEEDEKLLLSKGFQKICGEWIKDSNKIKKAQGFILFYGIWLDPSDEKIELKKQEILQKLEDEKLTKQKEITKPILKETKEIKEQIPDNDLDTTKNDLINRTQKITENIKNAFDSDIQKKSLIELINNYIIKKFQNMKENGISSNIGIIILGFLFGIMYFLRKK